MVGCVRHIDIVPAIHSHAVRREKPRGAPRSICAATIARQTGQRRHYPRRRHFPDRVVESIGRINVTRGVARHAEGLGKPRYAPRSVRTANTARQSGQRRHPSRWCHTSDRVVASVRHIDVARAVHRHAGRITKPCGAAGPVRAARSSRQSGQRRHHSRGRHYADCVVG